MSKSPQPPGRRAAFHNSSYQEDKAAPKPEADSKCKLEETESLNLSASASSHPSLENVSSIDTELSVSVPRSQVWEPLTLPSWVSESQLLKARIAKAEAWEAYASVAQRRTSQQKQLSTAELSASPIMKKQSIVTNSKAEKKVFVPMQWSSKFEYILTQVGNTLRPINIFRFSFLWIHGGNCIFLLVYVLLMFLLGLPLLFLEMAMGQRARKGSVITVWTELSPWIGGVGYSSLLVCFISSVYLNVTNTWFLVYLIQSFQYPVPWEKCPLMKNSSDFDPVCMHSSSFSFYWYRVVLKASDRIEGEGLPVVNLILPLFLTSGLLCVSIISGIKYTGKVMYAFVILPFLILLGFCIWSILLEEAEISRRFLLGANVSALYNINLWWQAAIQVLFTLSLGFGSAVSISSRMKQPTNCFIDALTVILISLLTMILSTVFVLCILGFWATVITHRCYEKNIETISNLVSLGELPPEAQPPLRIAENPTKIFNSWFDNLPHAIKTAVVQHLMECNVQRQIDMVRDGPNSAFVAFTEAMSFIPGSLFWTVLFFVLLLTLGLGYLIAALQAIFIPLQDTFGSSHSCAKLFSALVFLLLFLCGLFFIRPPGAYYIKLLSEYWTVLPVTIIVLLENIAVILTLGVSRLLRNTAFPCRHPTYIFWTWYCLALAVLLTVVVLAFTRPFQFKMVYLAWDSKMFKEVLREYPLVFLVLVICLFLLVILPVPAYFMYCLLQGIPFLPEDRRDIQLSLRSLFLSTRLSLPVKFLQKQRAPGGNQIAAASEPPAPLD